MAGYLKADRPGELQPPDGGWYATGDIVTLDDEGFVTIQGRVERFAKVGGEMVSLAAVETWVARLWPAEAHAVTTLPDPKKGEQLVLVTARPQARGAAGPPRPTASSRSSTGGPCPQRDGRTQLTLTPLELRAHLAALLPPP